MKYTKLGSTDLMVSEIGFGCMSLSEEDQAANIKLLQQAQESGINFFDTADLYQKGLNEATLGKAFLGRRHEVVIASKAGNQWRSDGSGWDWNPRKEHILEAAEQSLRRLKTDYIDLYQLHGGTIEDPIEETIEAFETLKEQGKIRHYGLSSIRPNVIKEWVNRSAVAAVMMQYSLLDRRPEESCLPLLENHNVGVLARGSLAQGLLAGKAARPYLGYTQQEVAKAKEAIGSIRSGTSKQAAVAAHFALHQPAVKVVVMGIRTMQHLQDALQIIQTAPLEPEEVVQLKQVLTPRHYEQHR